MKLLHNIPITLGTLAGLAAAGVAVTVWLEMDAVAEMPNSRPPNPIAWLWIGMTVFAIVGGLVSMIGLGLSGIANLLHWNKSKISDPKS